MVFFLNSTVVVVLLILGFQDFSKRRISAILVLSVFLLLFLISEKTVNVADTLKFTFYNAIFFAVQLVLIFLFYLVKRRQFVNVINTYLGFGDILLILAICPAFSPVNFILFYLLGLILTLIVYFGLSLLINHQGREIPLAGVLSIALVIVIFLKYLKHDFNPFNDNYFLTILPSWTQPPIYH